MDNLEYIEEAYNNYTYLSLNSYYKDPDYQRAAKLYTQILTNAVINMPKTKFKFFEWSGVIDSSIVVEYGKTECHAPGKETYIDSWLACLVFRIPFYLENIQFGYICLALIFAIIVISLFGGIKESYRWYILNQAIWDVMICYDYICEKPTLIGWHSYDWDTKNTCFYHKINKQSAFIVGGIVTDVLRYASFVPLLLLAFSRFCGIYFPLFYKRIFSKTALNLLFILIFNAFFILLVSFRRIILVIADHLRSYYMKECITKFCSTYNLNKTLCLQMDKDFFQCYNKASLYYQTWEKITKNIPYLTSPIMFFFAIFFALLLFIKVLQQLKFQLKQNRASFISTLKISCVILFQCFTMSIIFIMSSFQMYFIYHTTKYNEIGIFDNQQLYNTIPPLLLLFQYPTTIITFNVIRIFLDSFILLTVLNGYSSKILRVLKFIFLCFSQPKKTMAKISVTKKSNGKLFSIVPANKMFHIKR